MNKKSFLKKIPILIIGMALLLSAVSSCKQNQAKKEPVKSSAPKNVAFADLHVLNNFHDFGKIHDGDTVRYNFEFENNGKVPLIIHDISATCGCTVVKWSNKPVLPHGKGNIMVQFTKHHDPGVHFKNIIVKANTKNPYTVLHFKAFITT